METLAQLFADNPYLRMHRLKRPGLSLARNAAVSLSKGRWLAFLDDDAIPNPEWVNELFALISRIPPQTGAVGLYTYPLWPPGGHVDLPSLWIQYLSLVELEVEEDRTSAPILVGANMLLRRKAVIEVGGFPERLSRQRQLLLSGEEVYVAEKMRRKGWSIWYSCRPRAGHRIPRDRLDTTWFRKRMFWEGVTYMRLRVELDGAMPLFPVARALAFAPALIGLSLLDPPRGTRLARAMWHLGNRALFFYAGGAQRGDCKNQDNPEPPTRAPRGGKVSSGRQERGLHHGE